MIPTDLAVALATLPGHRDVVRTVYLTGSRTTALARADSDWDVCVVVADGLSEDVLAAYCADVARFMSAAWSSDPGLRCVSVPKLTTWRDLCVNLHWECASFGELFWRHAVVLFGDDLRLGEPTWQAAGGMRHLAACGAAARWLQMICFDLCHVGRDDQADQADQATGAGNERTARFGDIGRILRAIAFSHQEDFPVGLPDYLDVGRRHLDSSVGGWLPRALANGAANNRVRLSADRWYELLIASTQALRLEQSSIVEPCKTRIIRPGAHRPIPWDEDWLVTRSRDEFVSALTSGRDRDPKPMPRELAEFLSPWMRSSFARSGYLTYVLVNRWNRVVDLMLAADLGPDCRVALALREDLDRLRHYCPGLLDECAALAAALCADGPDSRWRDLLQAGWLALCRRIAAEPAISGSGR